MEAVAANLTATFAGMTFVADNFNPSARAEVVQGKAHIRVQRKGDRFMADWFVNNCGRWPNGYEGSRFWCDTAEESVDACIISLLQNSARVGLGDFPAL